MVIGKHCVFPLDFDVVAHAGEVRRRRTRGNVRIRRFAPGRYYVASFKRRRDVEDARLLEAGAERGGDVVLRACSHGKPRFGRAALERRIVRERGKHGLAVRDGHLVFAGPVGVEILRCLEAPGYEGAVRVVAVARRVEIGEIRPLRRELAVGYRVADGLVEGEDLRILRRVVGDVHDRARDEFSVRLLREDLVRELLPVRE